MNRVEELIGQSNQAQKFAITHSYQGKNSLLILAGAGTGKTAVLTKRIVYLIINGTPPQSILALTFTDAAAKEMKERCKALLVQFNCQSRGLSIQTFHSFGLKWIHTKVMNKFNWERLGFLNPPDLNLETDKKPGCIQFDDIVPLTLKLFKNHPKTISCLGNLTRHVLVDEFQDTTPNQTELIQLMQKNGSLIFLVGDDDQSIYGFNGADLKCFHQCIQSLPNLNMVKLEENYRSTKSILNYANKIFRKKSQKLRKVLISAGVNQNPVFLKNESVSLNIHSSSLNEVRWISEKIKNLISQYQLEERDFALLFRLNSQYHYYRKALNHYLGESRGSKVTLYTVHKSKGLQFPVVFFVGLENSLFPYFEKGENITKSKFQEEQRLFYVGVTRAESLLFLSSVRKKMVNGKIKKFSISPYVYNFSSLSQKVKIIITRIFNREL